MTSNSATFAILPQSMFVFLFALARGVVFDPPSVPWREQNKLAKLNIDTSRESSQHDSTQICHSSCPPWFTRCSRDCADRPWYEQERWKEMMEQDATFRRKALMYMPAQNSEPVGNMEARCYSACPPWFKFCSKACMPLPWFEQGRWLRMMEEDEDFYKQAQLYMPTPAARNESKKCLRSCPPFVKACSPFCASKPWHKQAKWVTAMQSDPEFREMAAPYLKPEASPEPSPQPRAAQDAPCHSACPPWFTMCTMQCMPEPWYKQKQWVDLMRTDSAFREKALEYVPKAEREPVLTKPAEEPKRQVPAKHGSCHRACPPWEEDCVDICAARPWYEQPEYASLLKTDARFQKKAFPYLPDDVKSKFAAAAPK